MLDEARIELPSGHISALALDLEDKSVVFQIAQGLADNGPADGVGAAHLRFGGQQITLGAIGLNVPDQNSLELLVIGLERANVNSRSISHDRIIGFRSCSGADASGACLPARSPPGRPGDSHTSPSAHTPHSSQPPGPGPSAPPGPSVMSAPDQASYHLDILS